MASPTLFAGNLAQFGVNGTNYDGNKGWTVEATGETKRTDNTADGGFSNREVTLKDAQITIELDWDAQKNLLDSPPAFAIGTVLTNLKCYLNGVSSPFWLFPKAVVTKESNPAMAGDVVKLTITVENKGTFTAPTGTFSPTTP